MAIHHAILFFTLIYLWLILASAQASPSNLRAQALRPIRTIKQRAFKDLDLLVARNYGKRIPLATARSYGKRAIQLDNVNNFLMEWLDLESRLKQMGYTKASRRDGEILLPE